MSNAPWFVDIVTLLFAGGVSAFEKPQYYNKGGRTATMATFGGAKRLTEGGSR